MKLIAQFPDEREYHLSVSSLSAFVDAANKIPESIPFRTLEDSMTGLKMVQGCKFEDGYSYCFEYRAGNFEGAFMVQADCGQLVYYPTSSLCGRELKFNPVKLKEEQYCRLINKIPIVHVQCTHKDPYVEAIIKNSEQDMVLNEKQINEMAQRMFKERQEGLDGCVDEKGNIRIS